MSIYDRDLAIRMANEGIPVHVIARATRSLFNDIHSQLKLAHSTGKLAALPRNDWPAGYPHNFQAAQIYKLVLEDKAALEVIVRRIFKLSPYQSQVLLLLVQSPEVHRDRLPRGMVGSNLVSVQMHRLRRRMREYGFTVETVYGYGYRMPADHRNRILDQIVGAYRS